MSTDPAPTAAAGNPETPALPRGRHRLPLQVVVDNQRRRLFAGVGTALLERAYGELTVKDVIAAAGVSRTTFYANFDNRQGAVLAAHRDAFERLLSAIIGACATEREWPRKVSAAIAASLSFMAAEPGAARLLTLNAEGADLPVAQQVIDSDAHLAALLRDGRRRTTLGPSLPDVTETVLIAGASGLIGAAVLEGRAASLPDLGQDLTWLLLAPYLGGEQATLLLAAGSIAPDPDSSEGAR